MPIDPSIPLGAKTPQFVSPADLLGMQDMVNKSKLNQLELQRVEAQKNLYANPENFQSGMPTDNALRNFGQQGGDVMGLQNDLLKRRQATSTIERNEAQARKAEEDARRQEAERYASTILPVGRSTMTKYNDLIKKGVPIEEATKQAQAFYDEQIGSIAEGGMVSPKYVEQAKQAKFNPYVFQARISQFSSFLGEKDKSQDAPKSRERKEGGKIITEEWNPSEQKWTQVSTAPRSTKTGDGTGAPGAAGGGLPKGVTEYLDIKTGKHYGVGKGLAFELSEDGKWSKMKPNEVPQKIVKVGSAAAGQGAREAVFTQRMLQAANQASKDLENVTLLPINVTSGVFGTMKPGPGVLDAGRAVLANKMTKEETQVYNAMSTGLQRTLAGIEAAGLMPSGQLTHQMEGVIFREGDTNLTKLHKLAQTRQIIESGMEVISTNPRVSEDEKGLIKDIIKNVNRAIPFTHKDLIELQKAQVANPKATLKDVMGAKKKEAKARGIETGNSGHGPDASVGGKKDFSRFWKGNRGSVAPKNVKQGEDPDEDSDDDKE